MKKKTMALRLIKNIDWAELKEQKLALIDSLAGMDGKGEGILSLIDALQDFAVDQLGIPEDEVFHLLPDDLDDPPVDLTAQAHSLMAESRTVMQKLAAAKLAEYGMEMLPGWSSFGEVSPPDQLSTFTCRASYIPPSKKDAEAEITFTGYTYEEAVKDLEAKIKELIMPF